MNKNASILKKQLVLYITILVVSMLVFGITVSRFFEQHYINKTRSQLMEQGEKISVQYARAMNTGIIDVNQIKYEMQVLENYLNASIFLMNPKGEISIVSSKINQKWVGQTLTDDVIQSVLEGNIVNVTGKIGGLFNEPALMVGYPIMYGNIVQGGIFMSTSLPELTKSIEGMQRTGFFCFIVSAVLGVFLVYWFTTKMTKPVLEMNKAAKIISNGNFENRIEIQSFDEIGQLAESFNQMAESLDRQDKNRRDFIANISHDLRSPLTSIQGFLNAIIDGTVPEEKREHYLNVVIEETKRISKLTNDIVTLSEAQSEMLTLDKTDFDINELIRDIIDKFEPVIRSKNITVNAQFEEKVLYVSADESKIVRVVQNLIDNAVKFTEENGIIDIETAVADKDFIKVSIHDSGKGISKEDLKYIFDRFYKTDASRGEDNKSGGLGLSIAKEFIKAHGGTITANSEKELGTEFIFTLKKSEE